MMEGEVTDAKRELRGQNSCHQSRENLVNKKKHVDGLSKIINHSIVKLGEVGSHFPSMHQKLVAACMGEA